MAEEVARVNGSAGMRSALKLLKIESRLYLREPIGPIFGFGLPILLLIIFGNIPPFVSKPADGSPSVFELYIPILIILVLIMIGLMSLPLPLARNREIGWLRRISTTPVQPSRLLLVQVIINLAMSLAAIVILLLGAHLAFGIPFPGSIPGFVISMILAMLSLFSLGLLIGAVSPTQGVSSVLANVLLYPFLFFSGVYVPVEYLPSTLQAISSYTPVGAAVKAVGSAMQGSFPSLVPLAVMLAYSVLFSLLAARYFKWE